MALDYTALRCWTTHPATSGIFAAIDAAHDLNDQIAALRQPDVADIDEARSLTGCIVDKRAHLLSGFGQRVLGPSHGCCVADSLWAALDTIRSNWIEARITDRSDGVYFARHAELDDATLSVSDAWRQRASFAVAA